MKYRADIDGLRALAVLPVVLFHSGLQSLSGGYVGVDVFFVISGYVITNRLVEDFRTSRYSITEFYVRRIRRIIPALIATIVLSYLAALVLFLPDAMADMSRSVVAAALFLSNIYFWKNSGYFETAALDRPLLHTWSLSVEEQFYIFIPVLMYVVLRWAHRAAWAIFALVALASFALSVYATDRAPTANFFLLPTRAWELLAGSLLVLAPLKPIRSKLAREVLSYAALGLIVAAVTLYTEATPFPGLAALAPVLGAAMLIYLGGSGESTVKRLLSLKPLVWTGLISYSLYLVHWPIIVFVRYAMLREIEGLEVALVTAASIGLAYLSYRFVEQPFRHPARLQTRPRLFGASAAALACVAGLGVAGAATKGYASRHPDFVALDNDKTGEKDWRVGVCFLENQPPGDWGGDACIRTHGDRPNALLWGDSFAAHYVPGLLNHADQLDHNIIQYTYAGCPPILSYQSFARPGCQPFNADVFKVIDRYDAKAVVISARWDQLRQRGLGGLRNTVERLQARGLTVYVIGFSPMFAFDVDLLNYRHAGALGSRDASWRLAVTPDINADLKTQSGSARFIDPLSQLCRGHSCTYKHTGDLLFDDTGHYAPYGSDLSVRSYFPFYTGARPRDLAPGAG